MKNMAGFYPHPLRSTRKQGKQSTPANRKAAPNYKLLRISTKWGIDWNTVIRCILILSVVWIRNRKVSRIMCVKPEKTRKPWKTQVYLIFLIHFVCKLDAMTKHSFTINLTWNISKCHPFFMALRHLICDESISRKACKNYVLLLLIHLNKCAGGLLTNVCVLWKVN